MVHMWIYCTTHRPSLTDDVSVMTVMYSAQSVALVALFFALRGTGRLGPAGRDTPSPRGAAPFDIAAAILMALCAVLLTLSLPLPAVPTVIVASASGGVGAAWAYARWAQYYSKLDIHFAAPLVFLTMALGSVGKTIIDILPAAPAAVILACLPPATFACLRASLRCVPEAPEPDLYYNSRTMGSLTRLALGIAVYSLTVGVVQSVLLEATPTPYYASVIVHHGSEVVIALAMVWWVVALKRGLDFSRTWRLILILMATALIFEPYLDATQESYLLSLVRTAQTFLIVFLFLALADIARHSPYHPMAVFALGWTAYSLPFMLGKAVGDELATFGPHAAFVMSVIVWLLVVVMLFVLDEASMGNRLIFTELNDGGDDDTPAKRMGAMQQALDEQGEASVREADVLSLRCAAVSDACGLTPREREILEMLVRGRSKAYIAEAYLISENTVRGHVKHIYTKLDVHGKQELLDKVEAASPVAA